MPLTLPLTSVDQLNQWVEEHLIITETALPEEDSTSVIPRGVYKNINPPLQANDEISDHSYSQPVHFLIPTHYHLKESHHPETVFTPGDHAASMLLNGVSVDSPATGRDLLTKEWLTLEKEKTPRDSVNISELPHLEIEEWLKIERIHSSVYATYLTFMEIYGKELNNLEIMRLSNILVRCNIVHQTTDEDTEAQKITRYFILLRGLNHYDRYFAEREGSVSEEALCFLFKSYGFDFDVATVDRHKKIIEAYDRRLLLEQEQEVLLTSIINNQDGSTIERPEEHPEFKKIYEYYRSSNQLTARIEKLFEETYLALLSRSLGVRPNNADDTVSVNVRASLLAKEENETQAQVLNTLRTSTLEIKDQLNKNKEHLITEEKKVQSKIFLIGASAGLFIGGCALALDAVAEAMSVTITSGHIAVGMKAGALIGGGLGGCFAGVGALPGLVLGLLIGGLIGLGAGIYCAKKENKNRNNAYATALTQLTQQETTPAATPI